MLRFLKIPEIFWKYVCIKILWKKSSEFCSTTCTKILRFLPQDWPYQETLRKSLQNLNSQIFPEKSDEFSDKFWYSLLDKIQSIFIRYFDMSSFHKSWNFVQILRNFFWEFYCWTKPRTWPDYQTSSKNASHLHWPVFCRNFDCQSCCPDDLCNPGCRRSFVIGDPYKKFTKTISNDLKCEIILNKC